MNKTAICPDCEKSYEPQDLSTCDCGCEVAICDDCGEYVCTEAETPTCPADYDWVRTIHRQRYDEDEADAIDDGPPEYDARYDYRPQRYI